MERHGTPQTRDAQRVQLSAALVADAGYFSGSVMALPPDSTGYPWAGTPEVGYVRFTTATGYLVDWKGLPVDRATFERWCETRTVRLGNLVHFDVLSLELVPIP